MQILFNGQSREIEPGTSIASLLESLEIVSKYVAVEVNLQLVPRQNHADHLLSEGDRLEVVTLVGGG